MTKKTKERKYTDLERKVYSVGGVSIIVKKDKCGEDCNKKGIFILPSPKGLMCKKHAREYMSKIVT